MLKTRFDTPNYELERPLSKGKNKVIGLMKYELGGKIMTEFAALRPKTYSNLTDDNDKNKKAKGTQKNVSQQTYVFTERNVFTEEVDKTALSANDDKEIKLIDSVETYAYGTNEEMIHRKEEIKCNNITKQYKRKTKENKQT